MYCDGSVMTKASMQFKKASVSFLRLVFLLWLNDAGKEHKVEPTLLKFCSRSYDPREQKQLI